MIDKLTPAQKGRFGEFVDRWTQIGLCTDPADRPRAEKGVRFAYAMAKLNPPKIVWCESPLSQGLSRAIVLQKVRDSVWDSVRDSVRASVRDSVRDSVWDSVRDSVGDSVRDSVGDSVGDSVWDSVRDSVRDSVWASVRDSVWDSVGDSVGDSVYGQHEAGWLSFYDFLREVCGLLTETDPLIGLIQVAKFANWWIPHERICWISERHNVLKRNSRGRLHSLNSPALQYPDGWSIYAIHGVRVPKYVVERPETITVEDIDKENNAEIRRVKIERYGFTRYLKDGGFKQLQRDDFGTLYEKNFNGDRLPVRLVRVVNTTPEPDGSNKEYVLPVRSTVRTAHEAVASSFGLEVSTYNPWKET